MEPAPTTYDKLLGVGLLGLALFAWLPDSYFRMVGWPWILGWQGAFLTVIGAGLWRLRQRQHPFYRLGFGLDWLVVGLLGCVVASGATSLFPALALKYGLLIICYIALLYGVRNSAFSPLQLTQGLVWVGAIAAVISLILWRPTADMWLSTNFYDAIRNRHPLGHHNFTGGYFVLLFPMAPGLAWRHSGWHRWLYGLLSLPITIALYASGSRGAWLGGVVLIVLALIIGSLRSQGKMRLRALTLSVFILGLLALLLISNPRIRGLVPLQLSNDASVTTAVVNDGPARDRVFMAQAAWNIIQAHPLVGLGPGNLGRVYERYRPIGAGTGLNQVQQLHNTPLQIAVELGLTGALVALAMVTCLLRVWGHLQRTLTTSDDRQLNLLLGAGFVGYGVSCLTDYQLENIPIATTLIIQLAALLKLAASISPLPSTIPQKARRWLSLLGFATTALIVQLWLRMDLAILFTHQGQALIRQGNLVSADTKFYTATTLAPWDPTPGALGAQQLSELAQSIDDETQQPLQTEALELYQRVLEVAPNDLWFNQNVAVLAWQLGDVATAHSAITRVVQLSPRSKNHSYYLLGLTHRAMGNTEAAIEALALENMINPETFLLESWQQDLAALASPVIERTVQHYQTLLTHLDNHPLQDPIKQHITTLRWWFDQNPTAAEIADSRPLLQALLTLETAPNQATEQLERCIELSSEGNAQGCRLLMAWQQPEQYLTDYLQTTGIPQEEKNALQSHIMTHRSLKNWLRSTTMPVKDNQRVALSLLYRSYYANQIASILEPDDLHHYSLPMSLNLSVLTWPRELPALDQLVETVRTETLGLPHPTHNSFQLTSSAQ